MTQKQRRFCDEYLIDCNATQAAIRAGYSKRTAYAIGEQNLKKLELKNYIDEKLEEISSQKTADAKEVVEYLTSVMRGEQKEETLKLCGDGCQTIVNIGTSVKERLKAAELIGKKYGIFINKVDMPYAPVIIVDDLKE